MGRPTTYWWPYHFGETEYSHKLNIAPRQAESLKEGDTVQVQVLPERPDRGELYQENYPYVFVTVLLCLFTLMPTAGLGKMLWQLYVVPWQLRGLMREGTATSGTIVGKKEVSGRSPAYTVAYEYQAPSEAVAGLASSAPVTVKAFMRVSPQDFQEAVIGAKVVVLYRPERPRRSVICRYADYEFVPSAFAERPQETSGAANPLTWHWLAVIVTAGVVFLGIAWLLGWW